MKISPGRARLRPEETKGGQGAWPGLLWFNFIATANGLNRNQAPSSFFQLRVQTRAAPRAGQAQSEGPLLDSLGTPPALDPLDHEASLSTCPQMERARPITKIPNPVQFCSLLPLGRTAAWQ